MRKLLLIALFLIGGVSHAQVTLSGSGVQIGGAGSNVVHPESYGAVGNGNTYFDGVLSASSNVLTSATAAFPSSAVGESCLGRMISGNRNIRNERRPELRHYPRLTCS